MISTVFKQLSETVSSLSEEAQSDLTDAATYYDYAKGTDLVSIGTFSDVLYFILKGGIRVYYFKDGKDVTDWFAFEGEFVCAITSYYMDVPSPHGIETLEDTQVIALKKSDIERLCAKHHDVEKLGRLSTTQTMLELQQRIVSIQFESARSRYLALLEKHKNIEQRAPLSSIASFLGITQETLSRIRSQN